MIGVVKGFVGEEVGPVEEVHAIVIGGTIPDAFATIIIINIYIFLLFEL